MQPSETFISWVWRHIAFRLPASWEMLQFSTEFNRGRCAFADRYQFRAELNWNVVKGEPDYERMVSNYMAKMTQESALSDGQRQKKAGWHGFSGMVNNQHTSRFGRYLPELDCLVEWAFMWLADRDPDIENEVLLSTAASVGTEGSLQIWRAFGMEMTVPSVAAIEGCRAKPARAEFSFTDPKTRNEWHMTRSGMVDAWLTEPVDQWLKQQMKEPTRNVRPSFKQRSGGEAACLEGEYKPEGLHVKWGKFEAEAWIDRHDKRLYCVTKKIRKDNADARFPAKQLLHAAPEFTLVPYSS